jgi:hypothetical protein
MEMYGDIGYLSRKQGVLVEKSLKLPSGYNAGRLFCTTGFNLAGQVQTEPRVLSFRAALGPTSNRALHAERHYCRAASQVHPFLAGYFYLMDKGSVGSIALPRVLLLYPGKGQGEVASIAIVLGTGSIAKCFSKKEQMVITGFVNPRL